MMWVGGDGCCPNLPTAPVGVLLEVMRDTHGGCSGDDSPGREHRSRSPGRPLRLLISPGALPT